MRVRVPPRIMEDPSFTLLPSRIPKQTWPLFCSKKGSILEYMTITKSVGTRSCNRIEREDYTNDQVTLWCYLKHCGQNPPLASKPKSYGLEVILDIFDRSACM